MAAFDRRTFLAGEAYDPATDQWEAYAPMLTPRHGLGAAVVGDAIHVAGGGRSWAVTCRAPCTKRSG